MFEQPELCRTELDVALAAPHASAIPAWPSPRGDDSRRLRSQLGIVPWLGRRIIGLA
jgi:hypothetical protein